MTSSGRGKSAAERAAGISGRFQLIAAIIGALAVVIAGMFILFDPADPPVVMITGTPTAPGALGGSSTPTDLPTPVLKPTRMVRECKPIASGQPFAVLENYDPSGQIGDLGDITSVWKNSELVHFDYTTQGRGPHEWDYKYIGGELNDQPAKFGGVIFLDPPNNWGIDADGGYDLRSVRNVIRWEARSTAGTVNVEFIIGGVKWAWDDAAKTRHNVAFPDSMPRKSLGVYELTDGWQEFRHPLSELEEDDFGCVVAAFGMVVNWGAAGPGQTYGVEVRNIFYEN